MNAKINKILKIDYEGIFPKLSASILIFLFINLIRVFLSVLNFQTWYITLNKPFYALPDKLFDPIWLVVFLLAGIGFYIVWHNGFENKKIKIALFTVLLAIIINLIGIGIFFDLKMPIGGFLISIALIIVLFVALRKFFNVSKNAGLFLMPYFLWIIYLSVLQLGIVFLN